MWVWGFFEVGGATRTSKTFATSTSRYKGPGAGVVALQRFWMKHQETALAPQQELPAGFAVLCKQGWQLVHYTPSCSPLHSHLIWKRCWVSAASSHQGYRLLGCVFIPKAAAEDPAQGQSAVFSTAWLCLLGLQANSCCRRSLDLGRK